MKRNQLLNLLAVIVVLAMLTLPATLAFSEEESQEQTTSEPAQTESEAVETAKAGEFETNEPAEEMQAGETPPEETGETESENSAQTEQIAEPEQTEPEETEPEETEPEGTELEETKPEETEPEETEPEETEPEEQDTQIVHLDSCTEDCGMKDCECPCHTLLERILACTTLEEIYDLLNSASEEELNALTEDELDQIDAYMAFLIPPAIVIAQSDPLTGSEIVVPPVNVTYVAPFRAPVEG